MNDVGLGFFSRTSHFSAVCVQRPSVPRFVNNRGKVFDTALITHTPGQPRYTYTKIILN